MPSGVALSAPHLDTELSPTGPHFPIQAAQASFSALALHLLALPLHPGPALSPWITKVEVEGR